jgi:hypothetical protein
MSQKAFPRMAPRMSVHIAINAFYYFSTKVLQIRAKLVSTSCPFVSGTKVLQISGTKVLHIRAKLASTSSVPL